ncbi:MAG: hypothetical protein WAK55_23940 [Xanthobacteraceae bacterium]
MWWKLTVKVSRTHPDHGTTIMAHRIAHLADKAHLDGHTLSRINSAIIFGLIGGGLLACILGALVYDIGRAFAVW